MDGQGTARIKTWALSYQLPGRFTDLHFYPSGDNHQVMRTITEFHASTLKNAIKTKEELLAAGKTAEELPAAMGEALKLEGDKLNHVLNALEVVGTKTHDLKRVVILALNENEKAPSGVQQKGEQYFAVEYFPPLPGTQPKGRGPRDGKRDGKRGDRKGKKGRGGRGDRGRGPRRGSEGELQAGAVGTEGQQRPEGEASEGGEAKRRRRRPPRGPRPPRPEGQQQAQAPNPNAGKKIVIPNRAGQSAASATAGKPSQRRPTPLRKLRHRALRRRALKASPFHLLGKRCVFAV